MHKSPSIKYQILNNINNSIRFRELYASLPPEAQHTLLHNHLLPLLDPTESSQSHTPKIISTAQHFKSLYTNLPSLDLPHKQKEVHGLLEALNRDSRCAFLVSSRFAARGGGSGGGGGGERRDALVREVIDSLTDWLGDIWSVVFEYRVNFEVRPGLFGSYCYLLIDWLAVGAFVFVIHNRHLG
jgi:hypothetical protein